MPTEALLSKTPPGSSGGGGKGKKVRTGVAYTASSAWQGDFFFVLSSLVIKDFKIRYRNMSLGVFWSVLNPIVMMGVLTFAFTVLMKNNAIPHYPVYLMCGLVPFNFFSIAFTSGTTSLTDNAGLIKRLQVPREIVPLAAVLSNCLHLLIQIGVLLVVVFGSGYTVHRSWLWLPYVWTMEVIFVCGLSLVTSALNVYIRDMRYLIESANTVLFWLVPIVYDPSASLPWLYAEIAHYNPLWALILSMRLILRDGRSPDAGTLIKLTLASLCMFAVGWLVFQKLKRRFYDHL